MDIRRILIDTSIIIGYLKRREKENSLLYNLYESSEEMHVSSMTVFELYYGVSAEREPELAQLFSGLTVIPFDAQIAGIAAHEYRRLQAEQERIDVRELVIGATAIAKNLPLATLNTEPFKLFSNVRILF